MTTPFVRDPLVLQLYVIMFGATDVPAGKWVIREQRAERGGIVMGAGYAVDSLAAARALVPPWADFNMGRMPHDQPHIVEVWV